MKSKFLFIHIGLPKCGSTTIQNQYFNSHPQINFLGKNYGNMRYRLKNLLPKLTKSNDEFYKNRNYLLKEFLKVKKNLNKSNKITLISYEGFTQLFSKNLSTFDVMERLFNLLDELGIKYKVIIFIRKQTEIIPSHYANTFHKYEKIDKRYKNFQFFLETVFKNNKLNLFSIRYDYLSYLRFFQKKKLKKNDFKFLIFEDLIKSQKKFTLEIEKFLRIKKIDIKIRPLNISKKHDNLAYKKLDKIIINNLRKKLSKFIYLIPKNLRISFKNIFLKINDYFNDKNIIINYKNRKIINNFYLKSNKKLSRELKIDLSKFGYF